MAKKSMILKQQAPAKFSTRKYNRCKLCGPELTPVFNYQRPFAILYYRSLAALRYIGSAESISSACSW